MAETSRSTGRFVWVVTLVLCGGIVGIFVSLKAAEADVPPDERRPLPHHFPTYPGGITHRFAMVQDVIHERYPLHGSAYYEERNRLRQEALKREHGAQGKDVKPSTHYWELIDDHAVGLERLDHHREAVAMMREKLRRQRECGMIGRDLYSSYANLGTFLILWQIQEGFADKEAAKARIRESIDLIRAAIAVKPDAHFGRERWQAVLEEFLLAVLDHPDLLLVYDMVGDWLSRDVPPKVSRSFDPATWQG